MRVLIVDEVHPSMAEGLTKLGFEVDTRTNLSLADFASILPSFHGLVVRSKFKITADLLENTTLSRGKQVDQHFHGASFCWF